MVSTSRTPSLGEFTTPLTIARRVPEHTPENRQNLPKHYGIEELYGKLYGNFTAIFYGTKGKQVRFACEVPIRFP